MRNKKTQEERIIKKRNTKEKSGTIAALQRTKKQGNEEKKQEKCKNRKAGNTRCHNNIPKEGAKRRQGKRESNSSDNIKKYTRNKAKQQQYERST